MEKSTRWQRMIKSLKYGFLPFDLIRYTRILTKSGKEYRVSDQEEFKDTIEKINSPEVNDNIASIVFEFKNRKIRKLVKDFSSSYFEKYFPTKPKK